MASSLPVYRFDSFIVRTPSPSVVNGLRADDRGNPTYAGVLAEHAAYIHTVSQAGVEVTVLPPLESFPDSIFVEDPALVFSEGAILLRPGAPTRAGETAEIAPVLKRMFASVLDLPRGFADGGDVLTTQKSVMIGLSARTNREGAEALTRVPCQAWPQGEIVETPKDVLHFKTDCSLIDEETVLTTGRLERSGVFKGFARCLSGRRGSGRQCAARQRSGVRRFRLSAHCRTAGQPRATPWCRSRLRKSARSTPASPACRCAGGVAEPRARPSI
jgi:N-Dimethylarginine dimethylaminohydrolase